MSVCCLIPEMPLSLEVEGGRCCSSVCSPRPRITAVAPPREQSCEQWVDVEHRAENSITDTVTDPGSGPQHSFIMWWQQFNWSIMRLVYCSSTTIGSRERTGLKSNRCPPGLRPTGWWTQTGLASLNTLYFISPTVPPSGRFIFGLSKCTK